MPEAGIGTALASWWEAASATELATTAASTVSAVSAIKNLTADKPSLQMPGQMPSMSDSTILAARRKQAAALSQQSGRMSTILTGGADKLGG